MRVIIVGGVAAGASAAARLRRLDESCEILLLEKGEFISYANCGLPYHLGKVIKERDGLLVMSPKKFSAWLNVDVRTRHEVTSIDPSGKLVTVNAPDGERTFSYDKLLLATGALPNSSGNASPRILPLWTISDMDRVVDRLKDARKVIVVGAGFVGLETAENLCERGLAVTIIQRGNHVLPTMDPEMSCALADELADMGIGLKLGVNVTAYEDNGNGITAVLSDNSQVKADFVIESIGVRPNSAIAREAGLECASRGHIIVNEFLQTSNPDIYAAGDAVEVADPIFGGRTAIALAGPANKQGRIAAGNILGARVPYKGTIGASVVKIGHLTAGGVGYTEERLKSMGVDFRKIYLHPMSNASYYPGAARLAMKLLFGNDGTIYGAQITGAKGVDKRIDTISQAMQNGLKAPELGELELAYAPPFGSAKDPVNFAGFIAENVLSGLSDVVYPDTIPADALVLDVREPEENGLGAIPGAVNIRLGDLRSRLGELDKSRQIVCYCQVGLRGYLAERILKQHGFRASNLSGGWLAWKMFHHQPKKPTPPETRNEPTAHNSQMLDVRGLPCPGPILKLKSVMADAKEGFGVHLVAARTFEADLQNWARGAGCKVENLMRNGDDIEADVTKDGSQSALAPCSSCVQEQSISIVLFSNDLDKALAAMILANGFAAAGVKVNVFFTFWGLSVLRKNPAPYVKKNFISKLFGWMLPKGARKLAMSKMDMMGMGTAMMRNVMKKQNVLTLPELIKNARDAGVRFIACDMAMGIMGITREELVEVDEVAGVATFAELAKHGQNALFI
mgnify:FL=1